MINEVKFVNPIRCLTDDGERAFTSWLAQSFYQKHNIQFHPVPRMKIENSAKTQLLHTSLELIDRMVRTIRDMFFNAGLEMTPLATKEMVRQHNNAPNTSLSEWMGFDISQLMVQQDKNKEEYIVMKINLNTGMMYDFDLDTCSTVKVYNEKDILGKRGTVARSGVITGKHGMLYKIKTNLGEELIPRFKITHQ